MQMSPLGTIITAKLIKKTHKRNKMNNKDC